MDGTLKYYLLDWDDNIVRMPTKIRLKQDGKIIEVSTSAFADLSPAERQAGEFDEDGGSYKYFGDEGGPEYFLGDLRKAIAERAFRPSYAAFKEALIDASLFGIVTARGHGPDTFRAGVRILIEETFEPDERARMLDNIRAWNDRAGVATPSDPLDAYLALNGYFGVTSPEFKAEFADELAELGAGEHASNPSGAKTVAVDHFVGTTLESTRRFEQGTVKAAHFGFSDDDENNIDVMQAHFGGGYASKWAGAYPSIELVFFTYRSTEYPFVVRRFG